MVGISEHRSNQLSDSSVAPIAALWDRGEVIGAAVLAVAGIAWFGWAQQDPPAPWVPYVVAGSVISALLLVALVVLLVRRLTTTGSPMADPRVRRRYWLTVAVEVVLIVVGNLLLAAVGHQAYDAAWTLFVVGVHFIPLGRVFHARGLALTGVVAPPGRVTPGSRRAQQSNTDQQMSFRNRWSSRTSSRIASGSWSRCQRHSRRPAASPSPAGAAARAALIA
ncbi:hypothetical protein SAMN04490239_6033 [Rhodococcus koreensis]|uniref:Uncharacterized protein n=1 Tax=Rhodococcus koreensis TaxID=99653 RepID=A0A1H4WL04_9NOCA|nr:hypothetical protein SAMN04490239_6033 [Rhodococcus koreensis]